MQQYNGNHTTTCSVTVTPLIVNVTGVSLNQVTANVVVGANVQLAAIISPSNATNQKVSWNSNNEAVASIDTTGKVTANSVGSAVITVTTADGNKTATCTVTVTPVIVPVTGVSLNQVTANIVIGANVQLAAIISPSNATNQKVSWNTNNATVASVDTTGNVTANSVGTAVITVTTADGNKTATCTVSVTPVIVPVTGVSVNPVSATLAVGTNIQLIASVSPSNATNQKVNWNTNNATIASVDTTGKVTANTIGGAIITVTTVDGNFTATSTITDTGSSIVHVTSVSVNLTNAAIFVNNSVTLTASVLPANATNKNVTWSTSNSVIASVDATGKVTGNSNGNATITVTTLDGNLTATCAVTVSAVTPMTDIFDLTGTLTVQGDHPPVQTKASAVDNNLYTKWLDFANAFPATRSSWLEYQLTSGQFIVVKYTITSAYDAQERDPRDWNLLGSNDGISWTIIDTRTGEVFANRTQTNTYTISNTTAYSFYKFQINSVFNPTLANSMQLAELELLGQVVTLKGAFVMADSIVKSQKEEISVFPNPTNGLINIKSLPDRATVKIYDMTGKEVYNRIQSGEGLMEINDANLNQGVYLISILTGEAVINKKIVIR